MGPYALCIKPTASNKALCTAQVTGGIHWGLCIVHRASRIPSALCTLHRDGHIHYRPCALYTELMASTGGLCTP